MSGNAFQYKNLIHFGKSIGVEYMKQERITLS